ncbi:MAG: hypothetical protein RBJ76_00540 [Stenomitos frigidus ULC029]
MTPEQFLAFARVLPESMLLVGSFLLLVILRQDQDVPFPTLQRS